MIISLKFANIRSDIRRQPLTLSITVPFLSLNFDVISFSIYQVFSINPFTNIPVFEDVDVQYKDWLTYFGGTDRPGECCYDILISVGL